MNSFADETQLYNHSEPILSFPDSGQCSLLTGLEKNEINANVFRPCCSEARAVGEERSTCTCEQNSCDTCFAQNAEKFKLIAATCNTESSAGFRTFRVNKMVAFLFVVGTLMFQASASTIIQARAPYDGPGNYLSDLAGHTRKRGEDSSVIEHAMNLLGEETIVDCLTNTATKENDAADAVADLMQKFGSGNYTLRPNFCRSREAGQTKAEICNKSGKEVTVTLDKVQAALDLLQDTCTKDGKSGKLTDDNVSYRIYAMSALGRPVAERRGLNKRCVSPDAPDVSGCMDDICEPKIQTNESGDCPWSGPNQDDGKGDDCGWYCEKRATKYYGMPEDYENTRFCTGGDCYLEEGEGFSFEKSISTTFEFGGGGSKGPLESVLGAGISFGFTWGKQEMVTQGSNFGEGKCGYWMKVPVMLRSCGVFSEYEPNFGELVLYCLRDAPFDHTDQNACSDTIAQSINGDKGDILVVPRWHDCKSRTELPMEEQSEQWKNLFDGSLGDADC